VDLKGFVSLEKIPEILVECDAYLFTGSNEGISIALLQALSYGLPTVVKQNQGNKMIFGKYEEVFASESSDPQDFARLLSRIYHDKEFRKFSKEVSIEIVQPFLWKNAIKKYLPNEKWMDN
jgi:glycosyltransferase involved in cell wall biosynthesis